VKKEVTIRQKKSPVKVLKKILSSWQLYALLFPGFAYILIFNYIPMGGIILAFKNYRVKAGIFGSPWLDPFYKNFQRFLTYPDSWKMIRNTLALTLSSLATFPFPIIFALLLNELHNMKFKKTVQMLTYMPHFLSEVVVCSLIIMFLDRTTGPIVNFLALLGVERENYMGVPLAFPAIYALSGLWQSIGWSSILYMSALSSISAEEVEAAKIDGASRLQIMLHINVPGIMPTIVIMFLLQVGKLMTVGFSKILLLQNSLNLETSNVLSVYVYQVGILNGQYCYSTAIELFNTIVNITILLLANAVIKKVSDTSLF